MSIKTIKKRIALVAVAALTAGVFSAVSATQASANIIGGTNAIPTDAKWNVAVGSNDNASAVTAFAQPSAVAAAAVANLRSKGLVYKDASSETAQTATMLAGGTLTMYTLNGTATYIGFTASGGSYGAITSNDNSANDVYTSYYNSTNTRLAATGSTAMAVTWTTNTVGTYTLSAYKNTTAAGNISSEATITDGTLFGNITVTVVASSAGGSYSAANSACYVADSGTAVAVDSTTKYQNGASVYIQLNLNDAYGSDLDNGNIVATATNGGLISLGSGGQAVGTASTVVGYDNAVSASDTYGTVRLSQPTAGAPLTSTVTITYNGTTVCTKTVTISGAADSMTIGYVGSGDIGTGTANAYWLINETGVSTGRTAGHYLVALKDSAGNIVNPSASDSFSMDSTTTTTTVTALTVAIADRATSTSYSATDVWSWTPGTFTCGPVAGSSKVKLKHTNASTGKIVSGEFTARCADRPVTYTASFDKASYVQGEIATLTVKFFDSKGNAANSTDAIGAITDTVSMMTRVTATGTADTRANADGSRAYKYTVGTTTGLTAGAYNGLIEFADLTALGGTTQTVTYKVGTGADTTSFTDVLKSVVALIASINKQIQALQKLIVNRKR